MNYYFLLLENFKPPQSFKCRLEFRFLNLSRVCNDIFDCKYGNDEAYCFDLKHSNCPNNCICKDYYMIKCFNFSIINQQNITLNYPTKIFLIENLSKNITFIMKYPYNLIKLSIKNSQIPKIPYIFGNNLIILILKNNKIMELNKNIIKFYRNLRYLDLSENLLTVLPKKFFKYIKMLNYLDISKNDIKELTNQFFPLKNLQILKLINCKIGLIKRDAFNGLINLKILLLNNSLLPKKLYHFFEKSLKLKILISNRYYLCCLTEFYDFNMTECRPNSISFSNCKYFIKYTSMKIIFWILAFFGIFFNITTVYFQRASLSYKNILPFSINISDIFISLYTFSLALLDLILINKFMEYEEIIKTSIFCSTSGIFLNFLLMFSTFSLSFTSIVKYFHTQKNFTTFKINDKYLHFILCFIILIISLTFSIFSNIFYKVKNL